MKSYTKKQLIEAQLKYNLQYKENPENFQPDTYMLENPEQAAVEYIDYLLKLADENI